MENQICTFYGFGGFPGVTYICFDEADTFRNWLVRRCPKTIYDSYILSERLQFPYEMGANKSQTSGYCNILIFLKHITILPPIRH